MGRHFVTRSWHAALIAVFAMAVAAIMLPQSATAATIRHVDPAGSDTTDCSNIATPCQTIVYAISQAVTGDTIEVAAGVYTGEQTTVADGRGIVIPASLDITIAGAGAGVTVIQAATDPFLGTHRVMTNLGTLTLTGVTLRNGMSTIAVSATSYLGGGLLAAGTTVVRDSEITRNQVQCTAALSGTCEATGGGVASSSSLELVRSSVTENTARCNQGTGSQCNASGGGLRTGSIAIIGASAATITDSTIASNSASCGGDPCNALGGGLFAQSAGSLVSPAVTNSTFSRNDATCIGDGCKAQGGGIFRYGGRATFAFITADANFTRCGGASCVQGGRTFYLLSSATFLHGSVLTPSATGDHCVLSAASISTVIGQNLATDSSCAVTAVTTDAALNLGSLNLNAPGTTETIALNSGSSAQDAVSCSVTNPWSLIVTVVTADQRGVPRPLDGGCDAGAYELDATPPLVTATVTDLSTALPYVSGTPTDGPVQFVFTCSDAAGVDSNTYPASILVTSSAIIALDSLWACTDSSGNAAADPAGFPVDVVIISPGDGVPPETYLGQVPPALTHDATPTFTFFAVDPAPSGGLGTFVCVLTPGGAIPCPDTGANGSATLGPLAAGAYRFAVAAQDTGGALDPTPAEYDFFVDPTPPVVTVTFIDQSTGLPYVPGTPTRGPILASFTCTDPAGGSGIPSGSGHNDTTASDRGNTYPGAITISTSRLLVIDPLWRCVDAAGNAADPPAGFPASIVIDRRAPTCSITLSRTSVPKNGTPTAVTVTVNGTDADSGVASRKVISISPAAMAGPALPAASPGVWTLKGALAKTFTITGEVTDLAGNKKTCNAKVTSR